MDFSFPAAAEGPEEPLFRLPVPAASSLWLLSSPPDSGRIQRSFSTPDGTSGATTINPLRRGGASRPSSSALIRRDVCLHAHVLLDNEEERMDSLWEHFNDGELLIGNSLGRIEDAVDPSTTARRRSVGSDSKAERRRAVVLNLVPPVSGCGGRSAGVLMRCKKPSLVMMLRVMKKLFVVEKSRQPSYKSRN